jgi:gamma-glutamyl-gamma-aminobutyrate hydrolase PuuD
VGKPVIGITTYLTPAAWGAWELDAALVPASYVRAVVRAGGAPLLVPPGASYEETLDSLDGLIFSGGSDLDPELYGEQAHPETNGWVRERDDSSSG